MKNDLEKISRGNTAPKVNQTIVEILLAENKDLSNAAVFDIPCGNGDFLDAIRDFFPSCETVGADLSLPDKEFFPHRFICFDARQENLPFAESEKFKLVTCISGVMEFDNTLRFFGQIKSVLADDGLFIVTNDNLLTVRDSLMYLLFGRFGQYKLFIGNDQPTWKIIPLQNLMRILDESGFEAIEIRYVPPKAAHFLWLPLALPIYFFRFLYLQFAEKNISPPEKFRRYPFLSLLARHYVLVCRRKT